MNRLSGRGIAVLAACLLCVAPSSRSGDLNEAQALDTIKVSFSDVDVRRIGYISQKMALSDAAANQFWPIYQTYLHSLIDLRNRQLATLVGFAGKLNANTLDTQAAAASLEDSMRSERLRLETRQQFIAQVGGILTPQQRLRLYQLELMLDAALRSELLAQIPLAE